MSCYLSVYFLVVFKTVLRGLTTFGFVGLKIVFWVLFVELFGLLIPFSSQALFSHVSPRGDPSRFCPSGRGEFTSASLPPKSHAQVPSILPSPSTLCLFTSGYTVVLRITLYFLIIFTNPSARAGYDTKSIFKRSLTGLNSEFSFS